MKNFRIQTLVIAIAALSAVAGASDAYLVLGDGPIAPNARFANRVEAAEPIPVDVDVDAWMAASQRRGSGGGAGKASFSDLSFMSRQHNPLVILRTYDKASPQLAKACATGQHIKSAKLFVRKAGKEQHEYYVVELKDVVISGYSISSGGDRPTESLSLNFTKVEYKSASKEDKALVAGWDLKQNKG